MMLVQSVRNTVAKNVWTSELSNSDSRGCKCLSRLEKLLSKQQVGLLSRSRAHSLRFASSTSFKASGHKRQGYCCQGKTNFRASCQVITITAFRTIRRRGCGHCATGPNFQTKRAKKGSGSFKIPNNSCKLAQAGFASGSQNVANKWRNLDNSCGYAPSTSFANCLQVAVSFPKTNPEDGLWCPGLPFPFACGLAPLEVLAWQLMIQSAGVARLIKVQALPNKLPLLHWRECTCPAGLLLAGCGSPASSHGQAGLDHGRAGVDLDHGRAGVDHDHGRAGLHLLHLLHLRHRQAPDIDWQIAKPDPIRGWTFWAKKKSAHQENARTRTTCFQQGQGLLRCYMKMLFHMIAENTKFLETFSNFFVVKQKFQKLSDRNFLKVLFCVKRSFRKFLKLLATCFSLRKLFFETSFHVFKHLQRKFQKELFCFKRTLLIFKVVLLSALVWG